MLIREGNYNFDHPDAFDIELLCETLQRLKEGKSVEVPVYNFKTHSRDKIKVREMYFIVIHDFIYCTMLTTQCCFVCNPCIQMIEKTVWKKRMEGMYDYGLCAWLVMHKSRFGLVGHNVLLHL